MATTFDVTSSDGTSLRCWRSDTPGLALVIANPAAFVADQGNRPMIICVDVGFLP